MSVTVADDEQSWQRALRHEAPRDQPVGEPETRDDGTHDAEEVEGDEEDRDRGDAPLEHRGAAWRSMSRAAASRKVSASIESPSVDRSDTLKRSSGSSAFSQAEFVSPGLRRAHTVPP